MYPPSTFVIGVCSKSSLTHNNSAVKNPREFFFTASKKSFTVVRASLVTDLFVKSVEAATVAAVSRQFITPQNSNSAHAGERVQSGRPSTSETRLHTGTIEPVLIPAANEMFRVANLVVGSLQTVDGRRKWTKLGVCILIDLIGSGGLGIPLVSDFLDIVTAPVSAFALHALYGNPGITIGGFVEEILPGTDGIPTATLAWIAEQNGYLRSPPSDDPTSDCK